MEEESKLENASRVVANQLSRVREFLNWRMVRGLGGLTLLTRASYIALLLVPLLAGTWPAVSAIVDQHNTAVERATESMIRAKEDLNILKQSIFDMSGKSESQIIQSSYSQALQAIDKLTSVADVHANDLRRRILERIDLPISLASTFFAGLFIAIAHLIYQLAAPENVRFYSLNEFLRHRKEDYLNHKSAVSLERARRYLGTNSGRRVTKTRIYSIETFLRSIHNETTEGRRLALRSLPVGELLELRQSINDKIVVAPKSLQENVIKLTEEILKSSERTRAGSSPVGETNSDTSEIELGARAEYLHLASRNISWIFISALLYFVGTILICTVIYRQAILVWQEANLTSFTQLFYLFPD